LEVLAAERRAATVDDDREAERGHQRGVLSDPVRAQEAFGGGAAQLSTSAVQRLDLILRAADPSR
jgi:hypothetical protein